MEPTATIMTATETTNPFQPLISLSHTHASTLSAIFDRLFPADDHSAAATQLGAVSYVDRALAGAYANHMQTYALGLHSIDLSARARHGGPFAELTAEQQDALLSALERDELEHFDTPEQSTFFALLCQHVREGVFADPVHGGNRDKQGWRFLGHPGVWLSNTAEENLATTPVTKGGVVQSLADLGDFANQADVVEIPGYDSQLGAAPPRTDEVDVILVGVGAVGGLIAPVLATAGLQVVAFEAGPYRTKADFIPDELRSAHYCRGEMADKYNAELPRWRRNDTESTRDPTISLGRMMNTVGGSVNRYAGWLRRFHPHHFHPLTHIESRGYEGVLPDGHTVADWPISYDELEPYYTVLDELVGIAGDDKNPFIPRRNAYPMPPLRPFRGGELFRSAAEAMGFHPHAAPVGVNSVPYDGRPASTYSAFSVGFGSFNDDRWTPGLTSVPQALATGNFDLRTHCRVIRVLTDDSGHANGVDYIDANGVLRTQMARTVILASYTFEIVRLMLHSVGDRHPDGLGNNSGQVGRHFMAKMFVDVHGLTSGMVFNKHTGPAAQAVMVDDLLAGDVDYRACGFVGGATLSCENQMLPLFLSNDALPPGISRWGKSYKDHLRQWQHQIAVRIQAETLPCRHNYLDLDPLHRDRSGLGMPLIRVTYDLQPNDQRLIAYAENVASQLLKAMGAQVTWPGRRFSGVLSSHDLGGCRMGEDPRTSVVNADLEVHDAPGLYVFSGATFPSCPGTNPTLSIWAVCYRAAQRLVEKLRCS